MTKYPLTLTLLLLIAFCGHTQVSGNKCPTEDELRRVLISAKQGQIAKEQRDSLYSLVVQKDAQIHVLEARISLLDSNAVDYGRVKSSYDGQIAALNDQIKEHISMLNEWKKEAKKWRFVSFVSSVTGVLSVIAVLIVHH